MIGRAICAMKTASVSAGVLAVILLLAGGASAGGPPPKRVGDWSLSFWDEESNSPRKTASSVSARDPRSFLGLSGCMTNPSTSETLITLTLGIDFDTFQLVQPAGDPSWMLGWITLGDQPLRPLLISNGPSMDGPMVTLEFPSLANPASGIRICPSADLANARCDAFSGKGFTEALRHVCGRSFRPAR